MAKKPQSPKHQVTLDALLQHAADNAAAAVEALDQAAERVATLGPEFSAGRRAGLRNVTATMHASATQLAALAVPPGQPAPKPLTPPPG